MKFQILTATRSDLEMILDLQKECYLTEAELHEEFNIPPLTQTIDSINKYFIEGTLFLKGIINGEIVASVRGYTKENTSFIGRLIVKKEFQNLGFGKALMSEIETFLSHCSRCELFTGYKSEKNIKLYQKLGYDEFKRQVVNDNLTLVYMQKFKK